MHTPLLPSGCGRVLILALGLLAPGFAQTPPTGAAPDAISAPAPTARAGVTPGPVSLELPRFKTSGRAELPRLTPGRLTVVQLATTGAAGVRSATRQNFNYLTLAPGQTWTQTLRGTVREKTYASFLLYASVGTTIDVGGAQLLVKAATAAGYASVEWVGPAGGGPAPTVVGLVKLEKYDGADLVALPVLTVRIDPGPGTWDLFAFSRLVADDVPLRAVQGARTFNVRAGPQGAWVLALVLSDEHPLFADTNGNGIDDAFEGTLPAAQRLATDATAAQRSQVVQSWKTAQATANVAAWRIRRPAPDGMLAGAGSK